MTADVIPSMDNSGKSVNIYSISDRLPNDSDATELVNINGNLNGNISNKVVKSSTEGTNNSDPNGKVTAKKVAPGDGKGLGRRMLGFFLGTCGSVAVAVTASCVQALDGAIPDFQLAVIRGIITLIVIAPVYCVKRKLPKVPRRLWFWLFIYSNLGAAYHLTQYIAVRFIPLGVAGCILRTVLNFSATLMARLVLKEKLTVVKVCAILVSVVGTFLVIQPDGIFDNSGDVVVNVTSGRSNTTESKDNDKGAEAVIGYVLSATAGLTVASIIVVQKAKLREVSASDLNLYPAISKIIVPLIAALIFEDFVFPSDAVSITLAIGQGLGAAVMNIFFKSSIHMTTAILGTLASSLQVSFLLLSQYTVLRHIQPGKENWIEIFGVVIVTLSAFIPPIWEVATEKLPSPCKSKTYDISQQK